MNQTGVLVVDDHGIVRAGICVPLARAPDMQVVGQAASGEDALEQAQALQPNVVLMDLAMPGMGGLEAIRRLKESLPSAAVLALTMQDDERYFLPVIQAGAVGYLLKEAAPEELLVAVRAAARGEAYLSPAVARVILGGYVKALKGSEQDSYASLTTREREVLGLAAEGKTNREIAEALCLSVKTVEKHRASLMGKLTLRNRYDLLRYALDKGLMGPKEWP